MGGSVQVERLCAQTVMSTGSWAGRTVRAELWCVGRDEHMLIGGSVRVEPAGAKSS